MSEPRTLPPTATIVLVVMTLGASIAAPIGDHFGVHIAERLMLTPSLVLHGEVYRLFSWAFLCSDPLALIIATAMLWRFGGDLSREWGSERFTTTFLGFAAGAGAVTCGVALAWPRLLVTRFAGGWPVCEALVICWALVFPERDVYLYLVARVSGRMVAVVTVAGTLLFALFVGFAQFVPDFAAEALALLFMWDLPRALRALQRRIRRLFKGRHLRIVVDEEPTPPPDPPPTTPIWVN